MTVSKCQPSKTLEVELLDEERQPCEVWTRVMGYHRPVASFNIGKKGEFHERRFFLENPRASAARREEALLPRAV